ncbi:Rpn family recombination-promoting nuclease/putative transposase [Oceanobacillus sp. CAU 1775]
MPLTSLIKQNTSKTLAQEFILEEPAKYKNGKRKKSSTDLLKRIPLHRLMDLKIDYAFKQLFGLDKNKEITIVFLNAILQKTGREPIKDISFLNIESGGEFSNDKQSRLDLLVTTDNQEKINVEIQFTNKYDMVNRSLYYWSGIFRSNLQKSMAYSELQTVISINILNFNLFDQTEEFHTTYHLYEDKDKFKLTNIMEFHYIEMSKLLKAWKQDKLDPWNDVLARWLLMLGMVDHRNNKIYDDIYKELEEIAMKDESLKAAFTGWEELSMTQEEFLAYESRLKHILDEEAAKRESELKLEAANRESEEMIKATKRESDEKIKAAKRESEEKIKAAKRESEEKIKATKRESEEKIKVANRESEEKIKATKRKSKEKIKAAKRESQEKGRTEVKIETAQRLLQEGMDIDFVHRITKLSIEEIKSIQLK